MFLVKDIHEIALKLSEGVTSLSFEATESSAISWSEWFKSDVSILITLQLIKVHRMWARTVTQTWASLKPNSFSLRGPRTARKQNSSEKMSWWNISQCWCQWWKHIAKERTDYVFQPLGLRGGVWMTPCGCHGEVANKSGMWLSEHSNPSAVQLTAKLFIPSTAFRKDSPLYQRGHHKGLNAGFWFLFLKLPTRIQVHLHMVKLAKTADKMIISTHIIKRRE